MRATTRTVLMIASIIAALVIVAQESSGSGSSAPTATVKPQRCKAGDFVISHVRTNWITNAGFVTLTGIIKNTCAEAAGPELLWTAFYPDGSVAFTDEFWPASTANIAPRQRYHFNGLRDIGKVWPHSWKYTVKVVGVQEW